MIRTGLRPLGQVLAQSINEERKRKADKVEQSVIICLLEKNRDIHELVCSILDPAFLLIDNILMMVWQR